MVDLVKGGFLSFFESHQSRKIDLLSWPSEFKETARSYLVGGKYLRSQLFFKILSSKLNNSLNSDQYLDIGTALEWIHSYSLVHDDLPCMDDDDFRRGKPSAHRILGEANAVLLGDALLTASFEILANVDLAATKKVALIKELTHFAGGSQLIAGQYLDLKSEDSKEFSIDHVLELHSKKTGALFAAAAAMACICSEENHLQSVSQFREWGIDFGILYQLVDDYLDGDGMSLGLDANSMKHDVFNRIESLSDRAKALGFEAKDHFNLFVKLLDS